MISETLDGWTLDVVRALVDQGVFETDRFDFKEMLPNAKDDSGKRRLKRDVAAFANSEGGFLIFGVKDDKGLRAEDRIVGLPSTHDLPEHFGSYASASEPSVEWTFKNPAIALPSAQVIHVVHVPPSRRRPHGLFEDDRWWFPTRTNRGTEPMTYEEVRLAFQDTENRRSKLALLSAELTHISLIAARVTEMLPEDPRRSEQTPQLVNEVAWTTRYPTIVVDTILGDALALIARRSELWGALSGVRDCVRRSNAIAETYSEYSFIRSTADPQQRVKLYEAMRELAEAITVNAYKAINIVKETLAGNA